MIFLSSTPLFSQNYSGGAGTKENPYQISTLEDLQYLSEKGESDWDKHFIMTNNIDASDTKNWNIGDHDGDSTTADEPLGWEPIGENKNPFEGKFYGQNYEISNLYINRYDSYIGLFGWIWDGKITNLGVMSCNISGLNNVGGLCGSATGSTISASYSTGNVTGSDYVGGLCGYSTGIISDCNVMGNVTGLRHIGGLCGYSTGTISDCYVIGNVNGLRQVGGLCGYNSDRIISHCYTKVEVNGDIVIGGLCGYNYDGTISNCYAMGNVTGSDYVGGFCGLNSQDISTVYLNTKGGTISNCYAMGNGTGSDYVGGFCGRNIGFINYSYSTGTVTGKSYIGGFVGDDWEGSNTPNNNFWDFEKSGIKKSKGGEGKSTIEMKTKSTFTDADWDFENIWNIDGVTNNGYPFLQMKPISVADEEKNDFNFTIYPNPAKNIINIDAEDRIEKIEIYDINGELQIETFNKQIDVSRLQNGIYQVVLRNYNQIQTEQLIIMR
jgi:hypothetical protein